MGDRGGLRLTRELRGLDRGGRDRGDDLQDLEVVTVELAGLLVQHLHARRPAGPA